MRNHTSRCLLLVGLGISDYYFDGACLVQVIRLPGRQQSLPRCILTSFSNRSPSQPGPGGLGPGGGRNVRGQGRTEPEGLGENYSVCGLGE